MAYDQIKSQQAVTAGHKTAVDFVEIGTGGVLTSLVIPANGIISLRDSHDYQNFPTGIILQVGATTYTHVAITWSTDGKSWTAPTLTTGQFYYDPDYGNVVCSASDQGKTITQLTIKSVGTRIRAAIVNKLLQNDKDIITGLETAEANIATAQSTANSANTAAANAQTTANSANTIATNAQTAANAAQSDVDALTLRVDELEQNPVATVEVFLTNSNTNLTAANAPTYKMALVLTDPSEIWTSDGATWTQRNLGGSGGFNYSPKINGFGLKSNSVSANGWTIQVSSISDTEVDLINGTIVVDGVDYQTLASITLGVPLEWAITGQSVGTHSCILKIFDEAHPGGITATVTVKLVLPTSTLNATATKSQMVVSGTPDLATQATITKIRVAYRLQGTDANADAAVTAGRYFDLTVGGDITAFQGAGYTKALSLTPGATYIPSVQVTANTGTGVPQTGGWTAGSSMLIDPAPTAPVISATATSAGNVTVILATASTDATPETPTYDIAVWDSIGSAWVAKQTSIAANSVYLTGTALGTSYATGTALQIRVTAKDSHSNATDSNIINLTVHAIPTSPALGTPTVGNTNATVAATTPSTFYDGATLNTYNWYKRVTGQGTWVSDGQGASPHTYSGLTNGAPGYDFCAESVDSLGAVSAKSAVVSGVPYAITYQSTFDGTNGTAPDTGYFTVMNTGGGTAVLDGSGNVVVKTPNGSTDGSMVYRTQAVTLQSDKTYKVKFKGNTGAPTYASGCALGVIHASSKTSPTVDATISPITFLNTYYGGTALSFIYKNSGGGFTRWNGSSWGASGNITGLTLGTSYVVMLETSTANGFRFTLLSADESTIISQTTWVPWSSLASVTASTWLFFGDQQSDYYCTNLSFDTFMEI